MKAKKIKIIKRTPDQNKASLIKALGGSEAFRAFFALVGDVDINTGAVDNYNTETEIYATFDTPMKKLSIMHKFEFNTSQYNYWKDKWRVFKAL